MEQLVTSQQTAQLERMLNDQKVSINNITIKPSESDEVFRPFQHTNGTKRQTQTFNEWANRLSVPREITKWERDGN